jgi:hypothetical protein
MAVGNAGAAFSVACWVGNGVESGWWPNLRILFSLGCRTFRMGQMIMGICDD